MTREEYDSLMLSPYWTLKDIQTYARCGKTKASGIRQKALKLGGGCFYNAKLISRSAVLEAMGLDVQETILEFKK